ncbi:MAG: ABC transporter permease subunit, partial [Acidimicrobiales bacterium]
MLNRLANIAAPAIAGISILAVWELTLRIINPDFFILPAPTEIIASFFDTFDNVAEATRNTGFIVITGLIAGVILGVVAALLVTRFKAASDTITPLAAAINAIPIIALAPIFNAWYGITSPRSNQAVVMVLVFFPVFINTSRGLTQVEPSQVELMR